MLQTVWEKLFLLQIHSVSDSEEEENKLVYPVKQEPASPERSQHSSKRHRDKHLDDAKERHRVKELSGDNTIGSENVDHIRVKSEPMDDDKHHKHKSHKSKKHEKSSSSTSRDKHSSSRHSHSDLKSSRREGKERRDGDDFNSAVSDVDLSIVKSEVEEERKKLKMKMKKEENDRNVTSNVDLSLVKKEKVESTAEKYKESTHSKHKSKERHSKDMKEAKDGNKVNDEWTENIHIKQERIESECGQESTKNHSERDSLKDKSKEKQNRNEQITNNDRKSNHEHKSKSIKLKTEEVESIKKDQLVRPDPEFDNHGISFEEMLMSGVTKVKKKKPTSSCTGNKSTKSEVCLLRWAPLVTGSYIHRNSESS